MTKSLKVIVCVSLTLNLILAWFLFSAHQVRNNIKKGIVIQYAFQQEWAALILQDALDYRENEELLISYLSRANNVLYHNMLITGNATPIGQYSNIPRNMYRINA